MGAFVDLTNCVFGKLTVISRSGNLHGKPAYKCRCECATEKTISGYHLVSGRTKSCGCLRRLPWARTHGKTDTQLNVVWRAMISRCINPKHKSYHIYGGKGVKVCDRWRGKDGFKNFASDMGERPSPEYSIDRKDSNGNYCPENCRWADRLTQAHNSSKSIMVTIDGVTDSMTGWMKRKKISRASLYYRLNKGMGIVDALSTPKRGKRLPVE